MPTVKCRKCYEVFEVRADAEWVTCKSCDYHFHTDLRKQLRHSKKARKRRGSSGSTEIGALGLVVFVVVFFMAVLADFAAVTAVQSPNSDFKETAFGALFMVFAVPHAIVGAYAAACFTQLFCVRTVLTQARKHSSELLATKNGYPPLASSIDIIQIIVADTGE